MRICSYHPLDLLVIGAIILGVAAVVIMGNILSDYQIMLENIAFKMASQDCYSSRLNPYGTCDPSDIGPGGMDIPFKIAVASGLAAACLGVFLLNWRVSKHRLAVNRKR
jgi:hypothetical protein